MHDFGNTMRDNTTMLHYQIPCWILKVHFRYFFVQCIEWEYLLIPSRGPTFVHPNKLINDLWIRNLNKKSFLVNVHCIPLIISGVYWENKQCNFFANWYRLCNKLNVLPTFSNEHLYNQVSYFFFFFHFRQKLTLRALILQLEESQRSV